METTVRAVFKTKPNLDRGLRNHCASRSLSKWVIMFKKINVSPVYVVAAMKRSQYTDDNRCSDKSVDRRN